MAKSVWVPGKWIQPKTTPQWWRSGAYGVPARKYQAGHWVDPRTGAWVSKGGKITVGGKTTTTTGDSGYTPGSYHGMSDADIDARANALADAQLASSQSAINRARAAAAAQAMRDENTIGALGQAQMGMINQIPANVQNVYNTAAQAMSQWGSQVSGAAAAQAQGEQAAGQAAVASQVGDTARTDTSGLNAQAAAAATAAIGGTIPAQQAISEGASTGAYAAGMPAVVARATQDQVAMRIADAATEDAGYRQQLIDLAATRGGVYNDALNNLYGIEEKKFGRWEAEERLKFDKAQFEYKQKQDTAEVTAATSDAKFKQWLALQQLQITRGKLTLAQKTQMARLQHELEMESQGRTKLQQGQQRLNQGQTSLRLKNRRDQAYIQDLINQGTGIDASASKVAGHLVDNNGNDIYRNGKTIPLDTRAYSSASKTKKGGVKLANEMASKFRGNPYTTHTAKGETTKTSLPPKVDYGAAFIQIRDALMGRGYKRPEAEAIAHNAMNAHYGNQYRPGKQRGK